MKILPRILLPATTAIERRHAPAGRAYLAYRPWPRWEFAFTCASCLVHEADRALHGVEAAGLTGSGHLSPRSGAPDIERDSRNCFCACRFFNDSRHTAPVIDRHGRPLLEPCSTRRARHFTADGETLRAVPGDADAECAAATYRCNDARRREMRRHRDRALANAHNFLLAGPQLLPACARRTVTNPVTGGSNLVG